MTLRHRLSTPSAFLSWRGRAIPTTLGSFLFRIFYLPISALAGGETIQARRAFGWLRFAHDRSMVTREPQLVLEVQVGVSPSFHHFPGPMDF
jgi:hypothetical protein